MAIGVKHDPTCPRCGYDLRGAAATWSDAGVCPLEGTCTECGLVFEWADVFDPGREEPTWCVEYAPRRPLPFAWAVIGTFLRSWLPWMFWKRLRLHHEVRLRRIAVYLIVLLIVPTVFIYVAMQSATAIVARHRIESYFTSLGFGVDLAAARLELEEWKSFKRLEDAPPEYVESAIHFAQGFGLAGLPDDYTPGDVAPASLSQEQWEKISQHIINWYEDLIADQEALQANPPYVTIGYVAAASEAVFTPFSETSRGTIQWPDRAEPYVAPSEIYFVVPGAPWWFGDDEYVVGEIVEKTGPLLLWLMLFAVLPLTFALLPITRRRAKVRWRHLTRVGVYSLALPIVFLHVLFASFAIALWHEDAFALWEDWIDTVSVFGPMPFALSWWYFAIRLHLRLPHALAVTVIMGVLSLLAVLAGAWVVFNVVAMLAN